MLDTNVVSALMRDPGGHIADRIATSSERVSISIVVAAELRYGAARKGSDRLSATVERIIESLDVEPLSPPVDRVYAALREGLERTGRPMGANDLLIAAHAIALGRSLATADRAFARVDGLIVEAWPE